MGKGEKNNDKLQILIKSKYSINTYLLLIYLLTILGITTWAFIYGKPWYNYKTIPAANIFVILIITFFVGYGLYNFYKKVFGVIIYQDSILIKGILFKSYTITTDEIQNIDLFRKGYVMNSATIVTALQLNNGKTIVIQDPLYRNMAELKQRLAINFQQKIIPYTTNRKININNTGTLHFPGTEEKSSIFFLNTIMLIIFSVALLLISYYNSDRTFLLISPLIIILLLLGQGTSMYYFILTDSALVIKNHYYFWYKKDYLFTEISAINFEIKRRLVNTMRVTTKDLKSNYFPADSLTNQSWQQLRINLIERGLFFVDN